MSICTNSYLKTRFQTACVPTQQDFEDFIDSSGGTWQGKDATRNIRPKDEGSTPGNTRGVSSVDLQTSRSTAENIAAGDCSFIGAGHNNRVDALSSVIVGGIQNHVHGSSTSFSSILGGNSNSISLADNSFIGGGHCDFICCSNFSIIGSGDYNRIVNAEKTAIVGGECNKIDNASTCSFIGGGFCNFIESNSNVASIVSGRCNFICESHGSNILGGINNCIVNSSFRSTVSGGTTNTIETNSNDAVVSGGNTNRIISNAGSNISGGSSNYMSDGIYNVISGGETNCIVYSCNSIIGGGTVNKICCVDYAFILGNSNNIGTNGYCSSCASIIGNNNCIAHGSNEAIAIGSSNIIGCCDSSSAVIGKSNQICHGSNSYIVGCSNCSLNSQSSFIFGNTNCITEGAVNSTIIGCNNWICTSNNSVLIGNSNCSYGGCYNYIFGCLNCATSTQKAILLGSEISTTNCSLFAYHDGSYISGNFSPSTENTFNVVAKCGTCIWTNDTLTNGVYVGAGDTAWNAASDVNLKTNITEIDYDDILNKVSQMPVTQWNLKSQDENIKHIGPMAQDFKCFFGLGNSEKHINTLDADGILFAAIKGLKAQVDKLSSQVEEIKTKI